MGLLRDIAIGAIGYGISELSKDDEKVIKKFLNQPIDCLVEAWAREHGIYVRSNDLSRDLQRLSENYRDPYA